MASRAMLMVEMARKNPNGNALNQGKTTNTNFYLLSSYVTYNIHLNIIQKMK